VKAGLAWAQAKDILGWWQRKSVVAGQMQVRLPIFLTTSAAGIAPGQGIDLPRGMG